MLLFSAINTFILCLVHARIDPYFCLHTAAVNNGSLTFSTIDNTAFRSFASTFYYFYLDVLYLQNTIAKQINETTIRNSNSKYLCRCHNFTILLSPFPHKLYQILSLYQFLFSVLFFLLCLSCRM